MKQTAFLALLSLLDFFSPAERLKRVIPELVDLVETQPDYLLVSLAENFGSLVTKLAALTHLASSDVATAFLQSYGRLSARDDERLRAACAYNFPALVKAFGAAAHQAVLLDDVLARLCSDPCDKVRVHVSAGLHEVAALVGQARAARTLRPLFQALIRDEATCVSGVAIARIPPMMALLCSNGDDDLKVRPPYDFFKCSTDRGVSRWRWWT